MAAGNPPTTITASATRKWSQFFDDPNATPRKNREVIHALALKPDAVVADIGSGTGYFSVRLAHAVSRGRVYGVDIEPDMVKFLGDRAKREKLDNVVAVAGAPDDPRLPEKVDLMLMVDVLHHIGARARYLDKLRSYLKPGGRIAIIDFRLDSPEGPPKNARLSPERVKGEFKSGGYALVEEHGFLPNQYFLVFRALKN
jgi:cyclopropane fatty-acyl-phospholipid synthase-like methyltransferase